MNTTTINVTEKSIASFEARRHFGKLIDGVKAGDKFVIKEHGEPVEALVPLDIYKQWKQEREAFFDQMEEIAQEVNLSPEEADHLVAEAVQAVRAEVRALN